MSKVRVISSAPALGAILIACKMCARFVVGNAAWQRRESKMAMSRSSSWKEHRLADRLVSGGTEYSVDLVARKATGVEGWKMTLVYLPRGEGDEVKVELPNAASTADVRRTVRELEGSDERLRELRASEG
jgi:hypothetical protein